MALLGFLLLAALAAGSPVPPEPATVAAGAVEDPGMPFGAFAADDQCAGEDGAACSLELRHLRAAKLQVDDMQEETPVPPEAEAAAADSELSKEDLEMEPPFSKMPAGLPAPGPLLDFYMYRAQNDDIYPMENVNTANLEGTMWYLHHEIVNQCPRRFEKTRILRLRVQMRATAELHANNNMNFGLRYAFDSGRCTSSRGFNATSDRYGFIVGCNNLGNPQDVAFPTYKIPYDNSIWYSLPGKCPSKTYDEKTAECIQAAPGGLCNQTGPPTGDWDCTYTYQLAGNISIDELSGIKMSSDWCQRGCVEYVESEGKGRCTHFWDDYGSAKRNQLRVKAAHDMFKAKYPDMPADLPTPACNFNNADYWGKAPPIKHKFSAETD